MKYGVRHLEVSLDQRGGGGRRRRQQGLAGDRDLPAAVRFAAAAGALSAEAFGARGALAALDAVLGRLSA